MALTNCSECGKEVSDIASTCPHCGFPIMEARIADDSRDLRRRHKLGMRFVWAGWFLFIAGLLMKAWGQVWSLRVFMLGGALLIGGMLFILVSMIIHEWKHR